jgi:glycine cleavage system H lipoate-binding protein
MNSDLEREFYCTIKLVSGEEIFCLMMVDDATQEDPILLLQDPVIFSYSIKGDYCSIKMEPWMKLTNDGVYFIRLSKVITMSEIDDIEIIELYSNFLASKYEEESNSIEESKRNISKNMGFLGSVDKTKKNLEDLYKLDIKDFKEP